MSSSLDNDVEANDTTSLLKKSETSHKGAREAGERWIETREVANLRLWWGTNYASAMGVCGIVLVALGSSLSSLAADCGTTSTRVGTVFIARGIGAIIGAMSSARLYSPQRPGNLVMVFILVILAGILLYMPFVTDIWVLHLTWFFLGMCTATLDTGCQIMSRKVHGVHAGPWLGANTVCFAIAGALVPLIELITGKLFAQYATLATISILNAAALYAAPHPESPEIRDQLPPRVTIGADGKRASASGKRSLWDYKLEFVFGATVFWLIGGKVDTTSYVTTYVKSTAIVSNRDASVSLLVLWIAITVGRLVGLQDQINLKKRATSAIYIHLCLWLITGTLGMLLVVLFSHRAWAFWLGVCLYGLGNGPCVGYVYDLVNRMTLQSETGMSIVMFGLNFGASLIPYLTTLVWDDTTVGPESLMYVTLLSMFIPMPLLVLSATLGHVVPTSSDEVKALLIKATTKGVPIDE